MTTSTITPATAAATASESARVALAASLAAAKLAGTAVLTKAYGKGADTASISLAAKAAAVMGGGAKPRGGAADRINKVITGVTDHVAAQHAPITAAVFAAVARTVLDGHKAAEAARRQVNKDARAAAKAVLNDRTANKADRIAALDLMSEIDAMPATAKADALAARVTAALTAARDAGMTIQQIDSILSEVFPVEVVKAA